MDQVVIRECLSIEELDTCVQLQRVVFGLPDLEVSPRRHLIVSRQAGGWTLGAFSDRGNGRLVGFVHHLAAVKNDGEVFGYSHMMAVDREYQNQGVGTRLKWAQRERALAEGGSFIKWTWDPMQARNAHFNLNRLGVIVSSYAENFYGTDYGTDPLLETGAHRGIDSDRLFAGWHLSSERVLDLAQGREPKPLGEVAMRIEIPKDWSQLIREDADTARQQQLRVRREFHEAFSAGLICAGFERGTTNPHYLLYKPSLLLASRSEDR
ncbi:MAG TPA: GNAT family N-acetyltransferase [Pyrinomonadaceae bacterium]|nr:GNAT family N-acetyltransferase [Pyrinomonadaceae bacterium]